MTGRRPGELWWARFASRPARRVPAGAFVHLTTDRAGSVYVLRKGLVVTSLGWRDGREYILRLVRPGELFGETSLGAPEYGEHARTLEASEIVEIPAAEVVAQVTSDHGVAGIFLKELVLRLVEAQLAVRTLAFAGTMERLCLVLVKLANQLGQPEGQATAIPHYIRQEDVARMTGARREVVSSLLNRLRERGVITYSRKGTLRVGASALHRYLQGLQRGQSRK